jgi:hypothetical protein
MVGISPILGVVVIGVIVAGSLVVGFVSIPEQEKQLIALQDVNGKIETNVPVAASRSFSPLPVVFDLDDPALPAGAEGHGSDITTEQKLVINIVSDTSEPTKTVVDLNNLSEDQQLVIMRVGAPPHVMVDISPDVGFLPGIPDPDEIKVAALVGHNEWLLSVQSGNDKTINIETSSADPGAYPIVVELLRVG